MTIEGAKSVLGGLYDISLFALWIWGSRVLWKHRNGETENDRMWIAIAIAIVTAANAKH